MPQDKNVLPTGKTWKLIHGDNLFAQDEMDNKKETLLATVEAMLTQKIEQTKLLTIHWQIV